MSLVRKPQDEFKQLKQENLPVRKSQEAKTANRVEGQRSLCEPPASQMFTA